MITLQERADINQWQVWLHGKDMVPYLHMESSEREIANEYAEKLLLRIQGQ